MDIKTIIAQYVEEIRSLDIATFKDRAAEVEQFRVRFLGRKGILNDLFEQFKALPGEQKKEIGSTRKLAYTDALTGIKNKRAFTEAQDEMQQSLSAGLVDELGIIVCDLNSLKDVNDNQGHESGDNYIKQASKLICNVFKHSPVYRIGGDEFVVLLHGEDFKNRETLLNDFDKMMYENIIKDDLVISTGLDIYSKEKGDTFQTVFERADKKMYARKKLLKDMKEKL